MSKLNDILHLLFTDVPMTFGRFELREKNGYLHLEEKITNSEDENAKHYKLHNFNAASILSTELTLKDVNEGAILKISHEGGLIEINEDKTVLKNLATTLNRTMMHHQKRGLRNGYSVTNLIIGLLTGVLITVIIFAGKENQYNQYCDYMEHDIPSIMSDGKPLSPQSNTLNQPVDPLIQQVQELSQPNQHLAELMKKGVATTDYSIQLGAAAHDNKKSFYVFSDPLCIHCQKLEPMLERISDKYQVNIFPVSKIGGVASEQIATGVLCNSYDRRATDWVNVMAKSKPDMATCETGNKALRNNNAAYDEFKFIGTPVIIRNDGAVFPVTRVLDNNNLLAWLNEEVK